MRFCSVVTKEDEYLYINLELLELFVIHYWIQKTMLVIDYSVHNIIDVNAFHHVGFIVFRKFKFNV